MRIRVCDICFIQDKKLFEAEYKIGFKNGVQVDVCLQHRTWAKQYKTNTELEQALIQLV